MAFVHFFGSASGSHRLKHALHQSRTSFGTETRVAITSLHPNSGRSARPLLHLSTGNIALSLFILLFVRVPTCICSGMWAHMSTCLQMLHVCDFSHGPDWIIWVNHEDLRGCSYLTSSAIPEDGPSLFSNVTYRIRKYLGWFGTLGASAILQGNPDPMSQHPDCRPASQ